MLLKSRLLLERISSLLTKGGWKLEPKEIAEAIASIADDRLASDIVIIDLSNLSVMMDYFVICSGQTNRQVQAIADSIEEQLRASKVRKVGIESDRPGTWVLLDYGSVIVHIFTQEQREYYQLERLWGDAPHRKWK